MEKVNLENQISCVVDQGIVYSKRDMIRVLRDLDKVSYIDLIDGVPVASGEGYLIDVYANSFDSTLVFNNRLHINVHGFEFLKVGTSPQKFIELVSGHRIIKLKPLTNILQVNQAQIEEEIDEQRIAIASQLACDNEVDIPYLE